MKYVVQKIDDRFTVYVYFTCDHVIHSIRSLEADVSQQKQRMPHQPDKN